MCWEDIMHWSLVHLERGPNHKTGRKKVRYPVLASVGTLGHKDRNPIQINLRIKGKLFPHITLMFKM
jgi:hypothetical protein